MKIRAYNIKDKDQLITLWQECGLVKPQNDPMKDIIRKTKVSPDLFLVGLVDDNVVASVMGGYEGHRGWINYLAVKPSFQRQGLGQEIMQAVEDRIVKKGCPKINLQVRSSNADVIKFYKEIGYDVDDVISLGKRLEYDS